MFKGTLLLVFFHYGWALFLDYCLWYIMISLCFWYRVCLPVLLLGFHVCCHLWCMISLFVSDM
ncbi:hypothetical protein BC941DRAFT_418457 [Chlamydoabsidia padenii]|nr:hypothetical protein BC941DRAFT_418457 [Chlamydoabsidia padenii]